jgi:hypothetical protein
MISEAVWVDGHALVKRRALSAGILGSLGGEVVPWAADVGDAGEDVGYAGSLFGGGAG